MEKFVFEKLAKPDWSMGCVARVIEPSISVIAPTGWEPVPRTNTDRVSDEPDNEGLALDVKAIVEAAGTMTWLKAADTLVASSASPEYRAVMAWAPTESTAVVSVVTPLEPKLLVPRLVVPSTNSTVPVGVPPELVSVAVRMTGAPCGAGLSEDFTVAMVRARLTVWTRALELLPLLSVSPLYRATRLWTPTARVEPGSWKAARPVWLSTAVPRGVKPSSKVTFPVGMVVFPETTAVSVRGDPPTEGFVMEASEVTVVPASTIRTRGVEELEAKVEIPL
jgi:hypothetical protein